MTDNHDPDREQAERIALGLVAAYRRNDRDGFLRLLDELTPGVAVVALCDLATQLAREIADRDGRLLDDLLAEHALALAQHDRGDAP